MGAVDGDEIERMRRGYIITHPEVIIDPSVPVPRWKLSERGRERMHKMLALPWIPDIRAVFCSSEQKAMDGAAILANHLHLPYTLLHDLGEVDRSSTGYLPREEHDAAARLLFATPDQSVRSWETALHAQQRFAAAVDKVVRLAPEQGDYAIVTHGGVATFFLCLLKHLPIRMDQAPQAVNGGCYYCFDSSSRMLLQDWQVIDP